MKKKIFLFLGGILPWVLAGCDASNTSTNSMTMASLPLVQNTIASLAPVFGGSRNDIIMEQVCALAQGQKTQEQFEQFFTNKGIALQKLAEQDAGFALLADNSLVKKQVACMAHLTSAAFLQTVKATDDKATLTPQLSQKLQVMVTNAEFFSLISERIEQAPATTIVRHKQEIIRQATAMAPLYFAIMAKNAPHNLQYTVTQLQGNRLAFSSSNGYFFALQNNIATLQLLNINWYGEGELLGKRHFIQVQQPLS
ncbi:hypothetical protein ACQ86O_04605 [Serratia sp. L9]|uniref:hypothetical protein n=1 Tax=Serratia sp. L9 TaxID=3423946 RepID=UPI003D666E3B